MAAGSCNSSPAKIRIAENTTSKTHWIGLALFLKLNLFGVEFGPEGEVFCIALPHYIWRESYANPFLFKKH